MKKVRAYKDKIPFYKGNLFDGKAWCAKPTDVIIYNGVTYKSYDNGCSWDNYLQVTNGNFRQTINDICDVLGWAVNLNWLDVSNITNVKNLFGKEWPDSPDNPNRQFTGRCDCWDTSNWTSLHSLSKNNSTFNNRWIIYWDTSNVTNMAYVFANNYIFNRDISGWDTSKVTTMNRMFQSARAFNQDLSGWCVGNVTDRSSYNSGATSWLKPKPNFTNPPC